MNRAKFYDLVGLELVEKHSISALVIAINGGRELNFRYKNIPYSITWVNNKIKLENLNNGEKQEFSEMEELLDDGIVMTHKFIDIWHDIEIDFLY